MLRNFSTVTLCGLILSGLLCFAAKSAEPITPTLILRGAKIVDGSGGPAFVGDVGIADGRIVRVGKIEVTVAGAKVVEAGGLVLTPGFIDLHNHSDRAVLDHPQVVNYLYQGATTLLCGNCGSSPTDLPELFARLREVGTGPNIAMLVGHGSVRGDVIGQVDAPPSPDQLVAMQQLVTDAMEAGAVGMSTGLRYRLGAYASTTEVVELARQLAPYGGIYATHMRDEGVKILPAFEEALEIGRQAGVPVHVSHHKISSASVWGLTEETLRRIDAARAAGMDVTLDQYPYGAGSSNLSLMVPQSSISGGMAAFRERISDPQQKAEILAAVKELMVRKLFEKDVDIESPKEVRTALSRIQIAQISGQQDVEGLNLAQILDRRKVPLSVDTGAELIVELVAGGARAIYHCIDDRPEGDADRVMQHPQTCISSDGYVFPFGQGSPHPRSYGTYPRVFARYVRERPVLSLEEAVHKMTALPAARLGMVDRGLIKPGYWADVVLFDPEKITDQATFLKPHQYSTGVEHVLVRGVFALRDGKPTGLRPGRPVTSVPVANSPATRIRRELFTVLEPLDARASILVLDADGQEVASLNAADPFLPAAAEHRHTLRTQTLGQEPIVVNSEDLAPTSKPWQFDTTVKSKAGEVRLVAAIAPRDGELTKEVRKQARRQIASAVRQVLDANN